MVISETRVVPTEEGFRVSGRVRAKGLDAVLFYEAGGGAAPPPPEMAATALLAAALAPAAWAGEDLRCEDACDAEFVRRATVLARGIRRLHGFARPIAVSAPTTGSPPRPGRAVGASFSAGVDSFYTLWANREGGLNPVGALVTAFGFDTDFDDIEAQGALQGRIQRVADEAGLAFYPVRTNFRAVFRDFGSWARVTHGSLLASLAFVLSGSLHTYLVPSSYPVDLLFPWGSHPVIDDAYVSSHTRVFHDSWEVHRNEKLPALGDWPLAMANLRVCAAGRGMENCGRCEKCVRTMLLLYLSDRLDAATSFAPPLTPELVRKVRLRNPNQIAWYRGLAELAGRRPEHRWVRRAIGEAILRGRYRIWRTGLKSRAQGWQAPGRAPHGEA